MENPTVYVEPAKGLSYLEANFEPGLNRVGSERKILVGDPKADVPVEYPPILIFAFWHLSIGKVLR